MFLPQRRALGRAETCGGPYGSVRAQCGGMRKIKFKIFAAVAAFACTVGCARTAGPSADALSALACAESAAIAAVSNPDSRISTRSGLMAPLYLALIELSRLTGKPGYWAEAVRCGEGAGWTTLPSGDAAALAWLATFAAQSEAGEARDAHGMRAFAPYMKLLRSRIKSGGADLRAPVLFGDSHGLGPLFSRAAPAARLYALTGDRAFSGYLAESFGDCPAPSDPLEFFALSLILRDVPRSDSVHGLFAEKYAQAAGVAVAARGPSRLWGGEQTPKTLAESALYVAALASGVNSGALPRGEFWPVVMDSWGALSAEFSKIQPGAAEGGAPGLETLLRGAVAYAGAEVAKSCGMKARKPDSKLVMAALFASSMPIPRAYAHIEPRRADDLAWENSKMAFRIYGPALYSGVENGGVDVWTKRVPYPVVDRWYMLDILKISSYHDDIGEGMDAFSVGDSVGCGGDGIWTGSKIARPNVYRFADVKWTKPGELLFEAFYLYENVGGEVFSQRKTFRMGVDDAECSVVSEFRRGSVLERPFGELECAAGIEVAGGIRAQGRGAEVVFDADLKSVSTSEMFAGERLEMRFRAGGRTEVLRFKKSGLENFAIMRADPYGRVFFSFGYEWGGMHRSTARAEPKVK